MAYPTNQSFLWTLAPLAPRGLSCEHETANSPPRTPRAAPRGETLERERASDTGLGASVVPPVSRRKCEDGVRACPSSLSPVAQSLALTCQPVSAAVISAPTASPGSRLPPDKPPFLTHSMNLLFSFSPHSLGILGKRLPRNLTSKLPFYFSKPAVEQEYNSA